MSNDREHPGGKGMATEANVETKNYNLKYGRQAELRSIRDALWEAINGIEEKAPNAIVAVELVILDHVADALGKIMLESEAGFARYRRQNERTAAP
jgi:hypothetical protein